MECIQKLTLVAKGNVGISRAFAAIFSVFVVVSTAAQAQVTGEDGAAQTSTGANEILVTASKRGVVSAQDLAASLTAFDSSKLERLDALDFEDFIVQVPSTNFLDNGGPGRGNEVASIRGISPVADNSVSVVSEYLDGAPRFGRNYRLFDIGEVSVLRGPQGTLWGSQSIGGLISYRSNRPDPSGYAAMGQADIYTTKSDGGVSYRLSGMGNIPIIEDKLAIRVAGHHIDESGYIDNVAVGENDINNVKEAAWRVSALFKPTDWAEFTVIYHGGDLETDAPSFFDLSLAERQTDDGVFPLPADQEYHLINFIGDVDLGWASLNYTGSYFDLNNVFFDFNDDPVGLGLPGINETILDQMSWTHEVRLASQHGGPIQWLVGFWYDSLEEIDLINTFEVSAPTLPAVMPFFGDGALQFFTGGPEDFREIAVFGEVSWDVTDSFQLLFGGRYFDWEVDNRQDTVFAGFSFGQETGIVGDDDFFYKVQATYRPTDNISVYALRSEGFRIGGFNPFVGPSFFSSLDNLIFRPDTLVNYEGGIKTSWLDNRVVLNAAGYFMDWKDVQVVVRDTLGFFAFTANSTDLEAHGFELELLMEDLICEGLYAAASYSYNKNAFQSDAALSTSGGTPLVLAGEELRRTPRNTWAFDVGYERTVLSDYDAFVRLNYWHKDKTSTEGFNSQDGAVPIPAQNVVNLSAGIGRGPWQLKLYADNVTDAMPLLQVFPVSAAGAPGGDVAANASTIRPRTIGLELTLRLGG